jgi:hypothetical protein
VTSTEQDNIELTGKKECAALAVGAKIVEEMTKLVARLSPEIKTDFRYGAEVILVGQGFEASPVTRVNLAFIITDLGGCDAGAIKPCILDALSKQITQNESQQYKFRWKFQVPPEELPHGTSTEI